LLNHRVDKILQTTNYVNQKKPLKNHWFDVRRKLERFRVLIFALSMLMSFYLAYSQYDRLGEIRFLSPNLAPVSFEATDQEDLAIESPADPNGIPSASFVNPGHSGIHPFKGSFRFSFHPFPFEKKPPPSLLRYLPARFVSNFRSS
jgi:hypothetical protein